MEIDSLHSLGSRRVQLHRDMKKRKKVFAMPSALDDAILQVAERCEPRRKKQKARRVEEEEVDIVELPTLEPVRIIETHEAANGGELYEEKKRRKKMKLEEVVVVSFALDNPISQRAERSERCRKKKAKKIKEEAVDILELPILEPVQIIGTHEAASGGESRDVKKTRRKKMKMEEEEVIVKIVETNEAANGGESHEERKKMRKKKVKMEEVIVTAEPLQTVESHESAELHEEKKKRKKEEEKKKKKEKKKEKKKKKKKKVKMEEEEVVVVVEPLQIVENHEAAESHKEKKKRKKKVKMEEEEVVVVAHTLEPMQIVDTHEAASCEKPHGKGKERRKKKRNNMEEDPSAPLALDLSQITEPHKKKRKKESPTDGVVYGKYSAEEDTALKQALFDFIREKGWSREDGIYKIIHSKSGETLGCWPTIGECLPHREAGSIYERARKLFGERLGKWTSAEVEALKELHRVHGNQWTKISEVIGRDRNACCRKWHNCVKWSNSLNHKTGRWSEEERQKLHTLVLKFLHEKSQVAKTGQLTKNHRGTRDDIDWVYIAEQMEGRSGSQCANKWYGLAA